MIVVTPIYAALIGFLFVILSVRVILGRRTHRVSMGDGGQTSLLRASRTQANCAEYAPIAVLLILTAELQGASHWMLHVMGLLLLLGRVSHAYGFGRDEPIMILRQVGMTLTFLSIILSSATNLVLAV